MERFVIVVLLQFSISTDAGASYEDMRNTCLKNLNIRIDEDDNPDITHPLYKCLTKCIYQRMERMDADGGFDPWKFDEAHRPYILACSKRAVDMDDCLRINKFDSCIKANISATFNVCKYESKVVPTLYHQSVLSADRSDAEACYQRCVYRQYKLINGKDEVNVEALRMFVNKGVKIEGTVKKCQEANKQKDECVRTLRKMLCIKSHLLRSYDEIDEKCIKELAITLDENNLPFVAHPKFKCLLYCRWLNSGVVNDKAALFPNSMNKYYRPVIKTCEQKAANADKCVQVNTFSSCIWPESINLRKACGKETKTKYISYGVIPKTVNDRSACFHRCIFKIYNFIDANDKINVTGVKAYIGNTTRVEEAVKTCVGNNTASDKCIRVLHTMVCIYKSK